jgi:phage terminase small subunit
MRGRAPDAVSARTNIPSPRGVRGLLLDAPEWLVDADARDIFARAAQDLAATGSLRPSDAQGLAQWAMLSALAARTLRQLAEHPNPDSLEAKRLQVLAFGAVDRAARLAGEFGLAPLPRLRLGVLTEEVVDRVRRGWLIR